MSNDRELLEIQQQLEEIMERLAAMFTMDHPRFYDIYEDVGATIHYIEEAGYSLEALIKRLQLDSEQ